MHCCAAKSSQNGLSLTPKQLLGVVVVAVSVAVVVVPVFVVTVVVDSVVVVEVVVMQELHITGHLSCMASDTPSNGDLHSSS